jgi:hypothetical protein
MYGEAGSKAYTDHGHGKLCELVLRERKGVFASIVM